MKLETLFKPLALALPAQGQTTAFTYQGHLLDGEDPTSGSFDVRATLHDAFVEGTQLTDALTNLAVTVTQGMFKVSWDFGAASDVTLINLVNVFGAHTFEVSAPFG